MACAGDRAHGPRGEEDEAPTINGLVEAVWFTGPGPAVTAGETPAAERPERQF